MSKKNLKQPFWGPKIDTSELMARPINPEKDLNFILSTWLKSYRNSEFAISIPNDIYFGFHQGLISQILLHPDNNVTILCSPEDQEQIIGYSVYNVKEPIIYYIYIKYPFRKLGLGRYLFEGIKEEYNILDLDKNDTPTKYAIQCTHKPRKWREIARPLNLVYNPYITGNRETTTDTPTKEETSDES